MKKLWFLFGGYVAVIVGLLFYSYTQVDLSLTLSRASIYQAIEKSFQYIGYFNRPLSTYIYLFLIVLLFLFYFLFLYLVKVKAFTKKQFWTLIVFITVILTFSYNAFSYDLFNYIFAAKLIVHYHQNPYLVHALDFPKDPMLSFMHWTHNTYQYGPVALFITLPFYLLGFGYFLVTFYLFKILALLCFLGSVYFLQKILHKINPEREVMGIVLFALNPLVFIESLVSAHNDIVMMFFALMGVYYIVQKKWVAGFVAIILSALTKDVTVLLLVPSIAFFFGEMFKKRLSMKIFIWTSALCMLAGFIYVVTKIEVQPWYSLWFLPFIFLLKLPKWVYALFIGFTLGLLLRYEPFLWQGDWNGIAPAVKLWVTALTPVIFTIVVGAFTLIKPYEKV